ncbi:hypothetical protein ACP70R_004608 [Stipagrostis hirtigluma subsp. patula]
MEATGSSISPPSSPEPEHKKAPPLFVTPVVKDDEGRKIKRTMRTTDRLQDLIDFYYAMVPTVPPGKGVFRYRGKRVDGERTPADCKMEDGDQIDFFPEMKPSMFISLELRDPEGHSFTRTVRRSDRMQDLIDYYYAIVPDPMESRFIFDSRLIRGEETPMNLEMEEGDVIVVVHCFPLRPQRNLSGMSMSTFLDYLS